MSLVQRSARVESPLGPLTVFGVEVVPQSAPPPDVVAVVDLSGSLAGPPAERALSASGALLAALPDARSGALVVAASPPVLVAPLGPLGAQRAALEAATKAGPRGFARGATTVARALDVVALELARSGRPAVVVILSDLAWGPDVPAALARVESRGAATLVVEATSAFTPATPVRAARLRLGDEAASRDAALAALREAVQATAPEAASGTLGVELEGAPPLAWFAGDERGAAPAATVARATVERGAARLAFVASGAEPRGRVVLALAGEKLVRAPLRASEAFEGAGALVRALVGGAP